MAAEKELLKGIDLMKQGKEEGFNILYSNTYDYVYHRAKFIMKNEDDACDLTQETFIQAYRGITALQDADNIYAWLGGIVYRQGMKIFRKRKELLLDEEAEGIFTDIVSMDKDYNPEEAGEEKATADVVMGMIEELPELQRAALVAYYYDNMKIDDIAKTFECSSNTIKSRLNYAKKFLKERVQEHERKYCYRLHSVSPAVMLWAFRSLFAKESYKLQAQAAQCIYNAACGTVGLTPAALMAAGVGTGVNVTGGSVAAKAGGAAAKAGVSLGAKIGITVVALVTAGAVAAGAMVMSDKKKDEPKQTVETSVKNADEVVDEANQEEEAEIVEMYGWETLEGTYTYRSGTDIEADGGYIAVIDNVSATSEAEEDVTFELEFQYYPGAHEEMQKMKVSGAKITYGYINVQEQMGGSDWNVNFTLMHNGVLDLHYDIMSGEGNASLTNIDPVILTKEATVKQSDFQNVEEGEYFYTTGNDPWMDGGYILTIKNVTGEPGSQEFDLGFDIVSAKGEKIDSYEAELGGRIYGNVASFWGTTSWYNTVNGYFVPQDDGSIALMYEMTAIDPDMAWYGAYPEYLEEPIILRK